LVGSLDGQAGYDIAASSVGAGDPLVGDIQKLAAVYPGFSALVAFDATPDNGALTWDFSATPGVVVDKVAAVPEPSVAGLAMCAAGTGLLRRAGRRKPI
jgi:hypothetical protein